MPTVGNDLAAAHGQCTPPDRDYARDSLDSAIYEKAMGRHTRRPGDSATDRQIVEHPGFVALSIGREELVKLIGTDESITYSSFVSRIFDVFGKAQGKPLVGDKTPAYVRRIKTLHVLWPKARFVHLIRDGRDVYLSMANRPMEQLKEGVFDSWVDHPVATAALWWELNVRCGREAGKTLGADLYCEIRYESLTANPREECAKVCSFLGVQYDDSMLRFYEGRIGTKGEPGKPDWQPITSGVRDWRSQMPSADIEQFEAAAGEFLEELAYPRSVPHPRSDYLETASKIRDRLARDPLTRYGLERIELERFTFRHRATDSPKIAALTACSPTTPAEDW